MLKKGLAWHYTAYDQRRELETVSSHFFFCELPRHKFVRSLNSCVFLILVGKGGSSKACRVMGFIKPSDAMGMEKGKT